MRPVVVVGLGLMGGSLLRSLSDAGYDALGWGPDPAERAAAAALPGVRVSGTLDDALQEAEGVVLATPLSALGEILERIAAGPRPRWVTDVASLQAAPLAAAEATGLSPVYVTSHPMAGGERSGFQASREGLYRDAPVWLSAAAEAGPGEEVVRLWERVGGRPTWIDAAEHDRRMAWASHLPQVVSAHLASVLARAGVSRSELGPGGRDATRLAGSDPRMWADILESGPGPLPGELRTLAEGLEREADRLERGSAAGFSELLRSTRTWSRS